MNIIKEDFLRKIGVIPRYTEIRLFLMSLTFLLVFATNSTIRNKYLTDIVNEDAGLVLLVIFLGIWLSIYNAFSPKKITEFSKIFLLIYAIVINVIISAEAYNYISKNEHGLYIIFPILNVVNAFVLCMLFKRNIMTTNSIIEKQTKYSEIIVGSILVSAIFFVSQYILGNYWAVTFSICLAYASNLNELISDIFSKK